MIRDLTQSVDAVELTSVRLFERVLRLKTPLVTGRAVIHEQQSLLVEITGIAGGVEVSGFGEAAALPGWGTERARDARFDALRLRDAVTYGAVTTGAEVMRLVRPPSLRFAVESALLDIVGRAAGKPIRRLLDPDAASSVLLNGIIGIVPPEAAAECAVELVRRGFGTLKLKVGDDDDVERVRAVRTAVGDGAKLRIDANGAWDADTALQRLGQLAAFDIELVEEPCSGIDALAAVARRSPILVAADETCASLDVARALVDDRLVGALVLKPALLGAWRDVIGVVDAAHRHDVRVIFTAAIDGVVGRWAVAQAAAALLDQDVACGLATGSLIEGDLPQEEVIRDGRLYLGLGSGLGFQPHPTVDVL